MGSMGTLIVPAAGMSHEVGVPYIFEDDPGGRPLILANLDGLPLEQFEKLAIIIDLKWENCIGLSARLETSFAEMYSSSVPRFEVMVLDSETASEPETVVRYLASRKEMGPVFIKDADSRFRCRPVTTNSVCIYPLDKLRSVDPSAKSYVEINDFDFLDNIVEKKVIGRYFCTGGYFFEKAEDFCDAYSAIRSNNRIYISHVIFKMLFNGQVFHPVRVEEFVDLGSVSLWHAYRRKFKTVFVSEDVLGARGDVIAEISALANVRLVILRRGAVSPNLGTALLLGVPEIGNIYVDNVVYLKDNDQVMSFLSQEEVAGL